MAEELANLGVSEPGDTLEAVCGFSRCSRLAEKDEKLNPEKRKALAKQYADVAMKHLQAAIKMGYKDAAHLKKTPDLDPLRQREDFKKLLAEMEGKK